MMMTGTPEQVNRVNQATLKMKKLELAELQIAYKDNKILHVKGNAAAVY